MPGPCSHPNKNSNNRTAGQYVPKNLKKRIDAFSQTGKSGFHKPGSQNRKK